MWDVRLSEHVCLVVHKPGGRAGLDDKILLWMGGGRARVAYGLGLGDDDMNRGSSQTAVYTGRGAGQNTRVEDLRVCDKRSETGRREEREEKVREGAKGGGRRGGGQGWAS